MSNKTTVIKSINKALSELTYVKIEVEDLETNSANKSTVLEYIEDVNSAIETIRSDFEDYDSKVSDIEDDLSTLSKNLSEVTK